MEAMWGQPLYALYQENICASSTIGYCRDVKSTEAPKGHALIKNGSLFFLLLSVDFLKWEFVF